MHNKANAKGMKATNGLLLQYEHALKAELESRKASYHQDMEVYEERITGCRKTFQSHKEYYYQNPAAQNLLTLQADKEEVEFRIKACDDQIMMKQKELDQLTGPAVDTSSTETPPDGVSGQQPVAEPEEQSDHQTEEERHASIDISSLHLNQTKNGNNTSVEANAEEIREENKVQYTSVCSPSSGGENSELWSCQPLDEQRHPDELHPDEQEQETEQEDQVLQSAVEVEEDVAMDEEQTASGEDNEGLAAFPQSSSRDKHPQSTPLEMTAVPSTPTFPFNFSPARSPQHGTSDTKSPAFLFSLNSEPSTPGFSGFGFEAGSSQDEESPFAFAGSFFNEKKTAEPKSSTCPEFLFGQPEQTEAFQFAFSSKSPQTSKKDNTGDDFPFSFNF
ncbi:uncharacterized protein PEZ65_005508 [Lycodopsis pacificus]